MKFANYSFSGQFVSNLGDQIQIIAIDYLYELLGIPAKDIVYIDKKTLPIYDGEYVLLPVNLPLVDYIEGGLSRRFSERIIPVFLGLNIWKDSLDAEEVSYLRRFEPIGGRDERTLRLLRNHGITSYLSGCITATFPRSDVDRKQLDKVFLVNVPPRLMEYIPKKLLENVEIINQHVFGASSDPKLESRILYEKYRNEAALIVTSLFHAAVPSMAAGIPVIMAQERCSYRLGWLEKLLPIYDGKDFDIIDWAPEPVEYEDFKKLLLDNILHQIRSAYEKYNKILTISQFYEDRKKSNYVIDIFESIKLQLCKRVDQQKHFEYAIYGLSEASIILVNYLKSNYPNAKLRKIYDMRENTRFEGLKAELPSNITPDPNLLIFVTAFAATSAANKLFTEIGRDKDSYIIPFHEMTVASN